MWKAPKRWWDNSVPPFWLRILAWFYTKCVWLHQKHLSYKTVSVPCPVISVGSLVMGGSGKTPITIMMAQFFKECDLIPVIVTRGYKGKYKKPTQVRLDCHSPYDVGEEAILLARYATTFVSPCRNDVIPLLSLKTNSIILLDDGHQHTSLKKNISFLVINSHQKLGNKHVFPAGPLREPMSNGFGRADAIFYIRDRQSLEIMDPSISDFSLPCFNVQSFFECLVKTGTAVIGFAGIGYPQRFHHILKQCGYLVKEFAVFPNHIFYTDDDEKRLLQLSNQHNAPLVTTEKDWIKLSPTLQTITAVVKQRLVLDDPALLKQWIAQKLGTFY